MTSSPTAGIRRLANLPDTSLLTRLDRNRPELPARIVAPVMTPGRDLNTMPKWLANVSLCPILFLRTENRPTRADCRAANLRQGPDAGLGDI